MSISIQITNTKISNLMIFCYHKMFRIYKWASVKYFILGEYSTLCYSQRILLKDFWLKLPPFAQNMFLILAMQKYITITFGIFVSLNKPGSNRNFFSMAMSKSQISNTSSIQHQLNYYIKFEHTVGSFMLPN